MNPPATEQEPEQQPKLSVLIVDDVPVNIQVLAAALKADYRVRITTRGEQALAIATSAEPPDLILLDVMMPGMDGYEVCRRLKAHPEARHIPVIFVTARGEPAAEEKGLALGAVDYIGKPFHIPIVQARVRTHLSVKREAELRAVNARLEQRVAERTRQLEDAYRELETFSYSVSHDLRAPLRAIDGFSRILRTEYGDCLPPGALDHLERICGAAQRMGALIDDLLQLSRLSRQEVRLDQVDLSVLAHAVADVLAQAEGSPRVRLRVQDGLTALADPGLLRIVLENLLGNAWKFTAHADEPQVSVGADGPVYWVRDNGAGFDMGHADKLFEPFQRLHADREFRGTGIGLATVKRIIQRHGGRIWAEGEPGKGACFYFTLGGEGG